MPNPPLQALAHSRRTHLDVCELARTRSRKLSRAGEKKFAPRSGEGEGDGEREVTSERQERKRQREGPGPARRRRPKATSKNEARRGTPRREELVVRSRRDGLARRRPRVARAQSRRVTSRAARVTAGDVGWCVTRMQKASGAPRQRAHADVVDVVAVPALRCRPVFIATAKPGRARARRRCRACDGLHRRAAAGRPSARAPRAPLQAEAARPGVPEKAAAAGHEPRLGQPAVVRHDRGEKRGVERRDVDELEAHGEIRQLPRRARLRVNVARGAEQRVPACVPAPAAGTRPAPGSAPSRVPTFAKATLQLWASASSRPASGPPGRRTTAAGRRSARRRCRSCARSPASGSTPAR